MFASRGLTARTSFLGQTAVVRPVAAAAPRRAFVSIEAAHKKGSGSTKNGRDSNSKRRGVKVYGSQEVKAGGIIIRQQGSKWFPGANVGQGNDYTLYSLIDGIVVFQKKPDRSLINVYPADHARAVAALAPMRQKQPKEGVPSRAERRKAMYKPRAQQRAEAAAVSVATVVAPVTP